MSPYETATGVILPIWTKFASYPDRNKHHAHFFKRHYLAGSLADKAIRFSRLQLVNVYAHDRYHEAFKGTKKPASEDKAFTATILNAAGYVPPYAVTIKKGEPEIIELSRSQKRKLRGPKVFSIEKDVGKQAQLGDFIIQHASAKDFEPEDMLKVEQFVELVRGPKNIEEQRSMYEIGTELTNLAVEAAIEPIEPDYEAARVDESLPQCAPMSALNAIKRVVQGNEYKHFEFLGSQLEARFA